jgi:energy-converting hydrogenase Eha subunit A
MNRRLIANIIGWLAIACSTAFWVWEFILPHLPFQQREVGMRYDLGVSTLWPALWLAGFLLAFVAAVIGSKRWIFAAIVPIVSCLAAIIHLTGAHF